MNSRAGYEQLRDLNHPCPDLATMAERELAAFFNAISRSFGAEQAELAAEDWLQELIAIDGLPASTGQWRLITAKASTRLASRLSASSLSASFLSTSPLSASSLSTERQIA
jgi:hypothetical protein